MLVSRWDGTLWGLLWIVCSGACVACRLTTALHKLQIISLLYYHYIYLIIVLSPLLLVSFCSEVIEYK